MEKTVCGRCQGLGLIHVNDTETSCPECNGKGSIEYHVEFRLTTTFASVYNVVEYKRDTDSYTGRPIEWVKDSNGNPMTFDDGQRAANAAKRLSNRWYDLRAINYSGDNESGDAERITPDAEAA